MFTFILAHKAEILGLLFITSEALAICFPNLKANSVFQLIFNGLAKQAPKEVVPAVQS